MEKIRQHARSNGKLKQRDVNSRKVSKENAKKQKHFENEECLRWLINILIIDKKELETLTVGK